jgi:hypothetical protein
MDVTAQPSRGTRRDLVVLGASAAVLIAGVTGAVALVHVVREYRGIDLTGRQWWPVALVECALALPLMAAVAGAGAVLRGRWRALRGRSDHLRVPLLVALLPGVLLGGALDLPFDASVSWAADHAPATAEARRQLEAERAEMQRSPTIRRPVTPAPRELARLLLRPADLGAGWYDGFSPNPSTVTPSPGARPDAARSALVRTHREGIGWALAEPFLLERVTQLPTAIAARTTAAAGRQDSLPRQTVRVDGVAVLLSPKGQWATFALGSRAFEVTLSYNTRAPGAPALLDLVRAAVRRAQGR